MRVKCLAQEHIALPLPGLKLGPFDLESSALTIRPPHLPSACTHINYLDQDSSDLSESLHFFIEKPKKPQILVRYVCITFAQNRSLLLG